jgi:hypothetical protein
MRIVLALVFAVALCGQLLTVQQGAHVTPFVWYVHPATGNDANDGRSPAMALKTAAALIGKTGYVHGQRVGVPDGGGGWELSIPLDGLVLWLRAYDLAGADGDPVAAWVDVVNGFVAAQATEAKRPVLKTNILNGRPVVRFSRAALQELVIPDHNVLDLQAPAMWIAVATHRGGDVIQRMFAKEGAYSMGCNAARQGLFSVFGAADHTTATVYCTADTPRIMAVAFDASFDPEFFVDGDAVIRRAGAANLAMNTNGLQIGGRVNQFWDGDLAEVAFYSRVPARAERDQAFRTIARRWGLSAGRLDLVEAVSATHAATPQVTPTYDGSGQVVHPSLAYAPEGWHGYKYWLGITPYAGASEALENPSILASNDGDSWEVPAGLTNPIVGKPAGGYNSDVDIVFSADRSTLWMYYREVIGTAETIYAVSSADGVAWSAPVVVLSSVSASHAQMMSPSVLWDGAQYRMWVFSVDAGKTQMRTAIHPLGPWSEPIDTNMNDGHLDVTYEQGHYQKWSLLNNTLRYHISNDGLTWFPGTGSTFLSLGAAGQWDDFALYRCSALLLDDGWHVWYTGAREGPPQVWRIGRTRVDIQ